MKFKTQKTVMLLLALTAMIFVLQPQHAGAADFKSERWAFSEFYKYDSALPLNATVSLLKETAVYSLYSLSYDSTHDKRIPALISIPKTGQKPYPVVLFMHGYSGNKKDVEEGLDLLSSLGCASVSLDAEYHGDRKVEGKQLYSKMIYSTRDGMVQTITDYRRAIDYVATRPEFDTSKIGFIGGSMGGILGAVLGAVEPRIKAIVLAVGGADWAFLVKASAVSEALGLTKGDNAINWKEFARVTGPVDPINLAQDISPRPVLMLNAKYDILVNPKANKFLFARLKNPKKIIWFDSGHALPYNDALTIASDFFSKYLFVNGDTSELNGGVEGYKTTPLGMGIGKPLPEPIRDMPLPELFEYESFLPLNPVRDVLDSETSRTWTISYGTTHDKKIRGDLNLPEGPAGAKFPAIIYLHELFSDRTDAEKFAQEALAKGFAVLAIDMEYCGASARPGREAVSSLSYTSRDAFIQNVFDARRAIDFLKSQDDILSAGIIAAKGKYSAGVAAVAAAVEPRITGTLFLPGTLDAKYDAALKAIGNSGKSAEYDTAMSYFLPSSYLGAYNSGKLATTGKADAVFPGAQVSQIKEVGTISEALDYLK